MLIRALILLLAVLNIGVAAWWMFHPAVPEPLLAESDVGERLELVDRLSVDPERVDEEPADSAVSFPDTSSGSDPALAAEAASPAQYAVVADDPILRCLRLGPYPDAGATRLAISRLGARAVRSHARQEGSDTASWSVFLAPLPDAGSARAVAARIQAAGLDDFFVISEGERANGIALGRYRNRDGALRRQAEVRAAGFDAQLASTPAEGTSWWIDVAAADGNVMQLVALAGAQRSQPLDCAAVR